jgi:hypothetical protein
LIPHANEEVTMPGRKLPDAGLTMTLIPGQQAVKALEDPEAMRALSEQVCAALGIDPQPDDDDDVDDPEPDRYEEDDKSDEEEDPTRVGEETAAGAAEPAADGA